MVWEESMIFGLSENTHIDFWAPTLNAEMHPCMAM